MLSTGQQLVKHSTQSFEPDEEKEQFWKRKVELVWLIAKLQEVWGIETDPACNTGKVIDKTIKMTIWLQGESITLLGVSGIILLLIICYFI